MASATFRFYGELNDFLPSARRQEAFAHRFGGRPAVKDSIEALGVPHPEVDVIVVNGRAVEFDHRLDDGDSVSVYPAFAEIDVDPGERVGPPVQPEPRFALDGHLGRLAAYLRMLGFDAWYRNDVADDVLALVSRDEDRILLTRDRALLRRGTIARGRWVRSDAPREQLREVVDRFALAARAAPFTRCIRCNGNLEPVSRAEVIDRLQPLTRRYYDVFARCADCGAVFWRGSHHARMVRLIADVLGGGDPDSGAADPDAGAADPDAGAADPDAGGAVG
jgi:hypothetical protein